MIRSIRRFRLASAVSSLALAASLAGCGSTPQVTGTPDMPPPASTDDMTVKPTPDLIMLAQTGDPCMTSKDCAPSNGGSSKSPMCVKTTMANGKPVTWTGGYCQSPCRPSHTDQTTFTNMDCPSDTGVCAAVSQTMGVCVKGCQSAQDCRDNYVCANDTGVPLSGCAPIGISTCDPPMDPRPQGLKCAMGQVCVNYSPDGSYGNCADLCDPVLQNCPPPPPNMGTFGCVVTDPTNKTGQGTCINVGQAVDGADCHFTNDCVAGETCFGNPPKCHQYCRLGGEQTDGGVVGGTCPMGQTCKDIKESGVMVGFTAMLTGICQ